MNIHQELMSITAEECGELVPVCMKQMRKFEITDEALAHTDDAQKWRHKLIEEVGDVYCMIDLLIEHGYLTKKEVKERAKVKRDKLKVWSKLVE